MVGATSAGPHNFRGATQRHGGLTLRNSYRCRDRRQSQPAFALIARTTSDRHRNSIGSDRTKEKRRKSVYSDRFGYERAPTDRGEKLNHLQATPNTLECPSDIRYSPTHLDSRVSP